MIELQTLPRSKRRMPQGPFRRRSRKQLQLNRLEDLLRPPQVLGLTLEMVVAPYLPDGSNGPGQIAAFTMRATLCG